MSFCRSAAVLLAFFTPSFSKELVYLTTGFSIEIESHTATDQRLICSTGAGTLEFPLSDVARIEQIPDGPTAHANPGAAIHDVLAEAATGQGLPPELVRSVAKIESGFNPNAISPKGAIGLMQLMPSTADQLGIKPNRAEENAQGGAKYLRDLLMRYHYDSALALAAYNAGPGAVDRYRGVPPYAETRQYVLKVLREYEREHKLAVQSARESPLSPASKPSATN